MKIIIYYTVLLQLNFCRYRKAGLTYRRSTANVQIPGFTDSNTYKELLAKGSRGLGIDASITDLQLIVSGGLVNDIPLHQGEPWSLGAYIQEIGGVSVRAKKTFGIYNVLDDDDEQSVSQKFVL